MHFWILGGVEILSLTILCLVVFYMRVRPDERDRYEREHSEPKLALPPEWKTESGYLASKAERKAMYDAVYNKSLGDPARRANIR